MADTGFEELFHNGTSQNTFIKIEIFNWILFITKKDLLPNGKASVSEEFLKRITELIFKNIVKSNDRNEKVTKITC